MYELFSKSLSIIWNIFVHIFDFNYLFVIYFVLFFTYFVIYVKLIFCIELHCLMIKELLHGSTFLFEVWLCYFLCVIFDLHSNTISLIVPNVIYLYLFSFFHLLHNLSFQVCNLFLFHFFKLIVPARRKCFNFNN